MIAFLLPVMIEWWSLPSGLVLSNPEDMLFVRWVLVAMAIGVFLSGIRDLYAALGLPGGWWPWKVEESI